MSNNTKTIKLVYGKQNTPHGVWVGICEWVKLIG